MKTRQEQQNIMKSEILMCDAAKEEVYYNLSIISYYKEVKGFKRPCLTVFRGAALKPVLKYYYLSEEYRQAEISKLKAEEDQKERIKREHLEAQKEFTHSLQIGDILCSSWGFEQTNIDFYQVINVKGKYIIIREIAEKRSYTDSMSGKTMPIKDEYIGESLKMKVYLDNKIRLNSYQWAKKWEGQPKYFSTYA